MCVLCPFLSSTAWQNTGGFRSVLLSCWALVFTYVSCQGLTLEGFLFFIYCSTLCWLTPCPQTQMSLHWAMAYSSKLETPLLIRCRFFLLWPTVRQLTRQPGFFGRAVSNCLVESRLLSMHIISPSVTPPRATPIPFISSI